MCETIIPRHIIISGPENYPKINFEPAYPEPGDGLHSGPAPVLHDIAANQGTCPPQARLTVH